MTAVKSKTQLIQISNIKADAEWNSRNDGSNDCGIDREEMLSLAKDIESNGLIQNPAVSDNGDGTYELIAGFRRLTALKHLGWTEVECNVMGSKMSEIDKLAINLAENTQRSNLDIIQEIKALKRFFDAGLNESEVQRKLNQTKGWIQPRKMLLSLPEEIYPAVKDGYITQANIRTLYTLWLKTNDKGAIISAAREVKMKRERGMKNVQVEIKDVNTRKIRGRREIFELQEEMFKLFGPSVVVKCLAWAAGEISDAELHEFLVAQGVREDAD